MAISASVELIHQEVNLLELYWPFEADDVTSFVVAFVVNQEEGEMLELSHYENCSAGDDNSLVEDLGYEMAASYCLGCTYFVLHNLLESSKSKMSS